MNWPFTGRSARTKTEPPEKKEPGSENLVELVLEALPFPAWIVDANFKTQQFNEQLVKLAKLENSPRSELRSLGIHAWFRQPEIRACLERGLARTEKVELQIEDRFFEVHGSPLAPSSVLVVFQEITAIRRTEQIRSDLVANVSHELRTPLTAIKGFTETLREDLQAGQLENAASHLNVVSRNVARLMSLIDDLLILSRLESGRDELRIEPTSTRDITERAREILRELETRTQHRIEVALHASQVWGDALRLEQVIVNLAGNALRYSPASSGPVKISWSETDSHTLLEISDSGPGIPEELHSRIFERFFRVDSGRSREVGGTGLGLAIVKHIISRHGGEITLQSAPGKGCTFICHFPKRSGESAQ